MSLVGIVVVSHSRSLAEAAVELTSQMLQDEGPPIKIAAGTSDGGLGTDATAVMAAITEADAGRGVAIFVDLGSALLSTEMAIELLGDEAPELVVVPGPFVEGLLAGVVRAAGSSSLSEVVAEGTQALEPKLAALAGPDGVPEDISADEDSEDWDAVAEATLPNPLGLHARPAALIAQLVAKSAAQVQFELADGKQANAASPLMLVALGATQGTTLKVLARGPNAADLVEELSERIADGFGESVEK